MNEHGRGRVVLISLYSSRAIGLRYISSYMKGHGFDVHLVMFKDKHLEADQLCQPEAAEYRILVELIREINPCVVGVSLRSAFLSVACQVTERVRSEIGVPILWGGTHPTVDPEECIGLNEMICIGEGERAMLEVTQAICEGRDASGTPNTWHRKGEEIIRNPLRNLVTDLDSLPFPDYGGGDKYFIEDGELRRGDPALEGFSLDVLAARGCPYRCSYCCNSIIAKLQVGLGKPVRRRSATNVVAEIEALRPRFKALKRIDFIDEVFGWDRAWNEEFRGMYKARVDLPFHCFQHPNMVERETLQVLKDAGMKRVDVGIQSGSERVRKEVFARPVSDQVLIQAGRIIKELKIVPYYDLIVENPFETEEDLRKGLELMLKLERPFYLWVFPLLYFPNTALTTRALEMGMIREDDVEHVLARSHNNMFIKLEKLSTEKERFWISLLSLTSKSFVPKRLILSLSHGKFLRRHPAPLVVFATLCNYVKLFVIAVKWVYEGKSFGTVVKQKGKTVSHRII